MYELTLKMIISDIIIKAITPTLKHSDIKNNITDTTIPTPEQEEEVYLFLKQCEKLGPPWI
jgi:hypothetical protein|tara:strand:- start:422 stop:604 length:183 start_codon:yes stop_codon:yes gene_type:complete